MLSVNFGRPRPLKTVLCLGAHSDDIEIGCGGTILTWLDANPDLEVHWIVFTAGGRREQEARRSAALFLKHARRKHVVIKQFRESYFPYVGADIKDFFEEIRTSVTPDVVFTHYRDDRHQDHREISNLTWNSFRDHVILEYEIPKFDGDLGSPNCFVPLEAGVVRRKVDHLRTAFGTQRDKHWFEAETFAGLMRLRGVESCQAGYAEAFYARKMLLSTGPAAKSRPRPASVRGR